MQWSDICALEVNWGTLVRLYTSAGENSIIVSTGSLLCDFCQINYIAFGFILQLNSEKFHFFCQTSMLERGGSF